MDTTVNYREYFIGTNEFNRPKVFTQQNATYVLLIRLILLEKGTYPTRPDMGVGLVSRYRYSNVSKMTELEEDIKQQVATYLPEFQDVDVKVSADDKIIHIDIRVDSYIYQLTYTRQSNTLDAF